MSAPARHPPRHGARAARGCGAAQQTPGQAPGVRWIRTAICLASILGAGPGIAAVDQAAKAGIAEDKAQILEQNSAVEGSKTPPSRSGAITGTEAQAVDPLGEDPVDEALTCLARTIYWEAKGEGRAGMQAVAAVVMNRLGHEGFPDTVCEVVRQGHEHGTCQFSWWCDGRADEAEDEITYAIAKESAREALNRQQVDRTGGAMYFHRQDLHPAWSTEYIRTIQVGEHVYYKPHGGEAK